MRAQVLTVLILLGLALPAEAADDRAEVERAMNDGVAAFARGQFERWASLMDPAVLTINADPAEVFTDRDALVAEMHRDFDEAFDQGLRIQIDRIETATGVEGSFAWIAQPVAYTTTLNEVTKGFHLRASALLERRSGRFVVVASNYSRGVRTEDLESLAGSGRLAAPAAVPPNNSAPDDLRTQFERDLRGFSNTAMHSQVVVVGPFQGDVAYGPEFAKTLLAERFAGLTREGDSVRSGLATGGRAGWLATNVLGTVEGRTEPLAMRLLVAYVKQRSGWQLAFAHLSIGLTDPPPSQ